VKYRHAHHAGNFADVHKHVTLLALADGMQRKPKGLLFLDTHAGRGIYELPGDRSDHECRDGIERLLGDAALTAALQRPELSRYRDSVLELRRATGRRHAYPGSPALIASRLRTVDRALWFEAQQEEFLALRREFERHAGVRLRHGDGFLALTAELPPVERRALILIDPPYEDTRGDYRAVELGLRAGLQRFATGVFAIWYPIKLARDLQNWRRALAACAGERPLLFSEFWRYPLDSRVGLNGSGVAIVNAPFLYAERMREWLPPLAGLLDPAGAGGFSITEV
jgi:23S rRNA (adenine2030-N6)-methyltransferase